MFGSDNNGESAEESICSPDHMPEVSIEHVFSFQNRK